MSASRGPISRSRRSLPSNTSATARIGIHGNYCPSVAEQLTLDIDIPSPGPLLVITVEDTETSEVVSGKASSGFQIQIAQLGEVLAQVLDFHEAFDLPREPLPTDNVDDDLAQLRVRLLREEVEEFADAVERRDLIAIADALADVVYVAYGSAITYGLDLDAVVREIHSSNMSKLGSDGRPVLRDDGKVLKSDRYRPPDIGRIADNQLPLFASDGRTTGAASSLAAG